MNFRIYLSISVELSWDFDRASYTLLWKYHLAYFLTEGQSSFSKGNPQRGTWVAQVVDQLTVDFGSAHDPQGHEIESYIRLLLPLPLLFPLHAFLSNK